MKRSDSYNNSRGLSYLTSKKCGIALFIIFFTTSLSDVKNLTAQVRATGHVFAEIVEPTTLSASATNDHIIYQNDNIASDNLVLAEVTVSGPNTDIGVSVQTTGLEGKNGETYPLDAFVCPDCNADGQKAGANEKVFMLTGTPGQDILSGKDNLFTGQYKVTFMYN